MKDGFDLVTDIRSLINIPEITGLIDGKIYPNLRPDNSTKTDIVINSTTINNTQNQIGYGNINVYVPTISVANGNGGQQQFPDQAKMNTMCKAITPYVESQYRATFRTEVQDAGNIYQDTDGSWFINIRLKYRSLQDNYKNI
jgi:hypothetical protein